jgi:hypothetical protein
MLDDQERQQRGHNKTYEERKHYYFSDATRRMMAIGAEKWDGHARFDWRFPSC